MIKHVFNSLHQVLNIKWQAKIILKYKNIYIKKQKKKDEMSEIYQYIYYYFYGRRKLDDKSSPEKYFYENTKVKTNLKDIFLKIFGRRD